MLNTQPLNIVEKNIKCSCGHENLKTFNSPVDFSFSINSKNKEPNLGITCEKCEKFINASTFLNESEYSKVKNNLLNSICNL